MQGSSESPCIAGSTFGVNLQKLAHLRNEKLPPQHRQPYAKLFTWQLGMLLMVRALGTCAESSTQFSTTQLAVLS